MGSKARGQRLILNRNLENVCTEHVKMAEALHTGGFC